MIKKLFNRLWLFIEFSCLKINTFNKGFLFSNIYKILYYSFSCKTFSFSASIQYSKKQLEHWVCLLINTWTRSKFIFSSSYGTFRWFNRAFMLRVIVRVGDEKWTLFWNDSIMAILRDLKRGRSVSKNHPFCNCKPFDGTAGVKKRFDIEVFDHNSNDRHRFFAPFFTRLASFYFIELFFYESLC